MLDVLNEGVKPVVHVEDAKLVAGFDKGGEGAGLAGSDRHALPRFDGAAGIFDAPIATRLEPLDRFFPAEDYHHDYARRNPDQPYIRAVAEPKVRKLVETYPEELKPQARRQSERA